MIEMMKQLWAKYGEILRYLIVGALTTAVSLGSYYICVTWVFDVNFPLELQSANVISWVCAVTFAYITNRVFVFESTNKKILKEIGLFLGARVSSLVMDMVIMFVGVTLLGWNDKGVKLLVQAVVLIANYILSKWIVFRK